MFKVSLLLVFLTCAASGYAQRKIAGSVKANGEPLASVVVSSGAQFATTDSTGKYVLEIDHDNKFVQITNPSGYLVPTKQGVPQHYLVLEDTKNHYDFVLDKNNNDESEHILIVQTDVQVANLEELSSYKKYLVPDISQTIKSYGKREVVGIDLGDMVGDDPTLFEPYINTVDKLHVPFYRVIGNHDMAYWGRSFETSESHFNKYFGPTCYSFNKGNAHYIVINNNFYVGRDYFYIGYINEAIFKWIEKDLSYVPQGSLVFLLTHIPTRLSTAKPDFAYNYSYLGAETVNADALFQLLKPHNAHILSGHTHKNLNISHNDNLYEHNIAAASGSWWQTSLCTDGTPRGYAVFEITNTDVKWYYKSEGHDRNHQFRASINKLNELVVNVWNHDPAWKVEWYEDGVKVGALNQVEGIDEFVSKQIQAKTDMKYTWIAPSKSKNLFKATLRNTNAKIKVCVTDRFGNVFEEFLNK